MQIGYKLISWVPQSCSDELSYQSFLLANCLIFISGWVWRRLIRKSEQGGLIGRGLIDAYVRSNVWYIPSTVPHGEILCSRSHTSNLKRKLDAHVCCFRRGLLYGNELVELPSSVDPRGILRSISWSRKMLFYRCGIKKEGVQPGGEKSARDRGQYSLSSPSPLHRNRSILLLIHIPLENDMVTQFLEVSIDFDCSRKSIEKRLSHWLNMGWLGSVILATFLTVLHGQLSDLGTNVASVSILSGSGFWIATLIAQKRIDDIAAATMNTLPGLLSSLHAELLCHYPRATAKVQILEIERDDEFDSRPKRWFLSSHAPAQYNDARSAVLMWNVSPSLERSWIGITLSGVVKRSRRPLCMSETFLDAFTILFVTLASFSMSTASTIFPSEAAFGRAENIPIILLFSITFLIRPHYFLVMELSFLLPYILLLTRFDYRPAANQTNTEKGNVSFEHGSATTWLSYIVAGLWPYWIVAENICPRV